MQWGVTGSKGAGPGLDITDLERSIPAMWAGSGAGHIFVGAAGGAGR